MDIRKFFDTMSLSSRYLVVKFLVLPYEDIDLYVCVPESWQRWEDCDGEVAIAYPEEKPKDTSERVEKYEDCSKRWKIYMAQKYCIEDSYEGALQKIISLRKSESKTEDILDKLQNMKIEQSENNSNQNILSTPKSNCIQNKKNTPSTSTPKTVKMETEEINNQESGKEKTEVNTIPQNKTLQSPYKILEDFNPKDLKHMFRHNSSILGEVVELLPDTGVFIEVNVLKTKFTNYSAMTEGLMKGIFTNKALSNCTLSGEPSISKNHSKSETRPALDQDAREAIIKYVYDNCYKEWKNGRNQIEGTMRNVLKKFKPKEKLDKTT